MKTITLRLAILIFAMSGSDHFAEAAPQVGDKAPRFSLQGSDGNTYSTVDFEGKQAMVVAWFPKAFTGG
ncbi:MAG: redoxin domain-containing protein [Verrucomicrobiota bacterium]